MMSSSTTEFGRFFKGWSIADKKKIIENSYKIYDTDHYSHIVRYMTYKSIHFKRGYMHLDFWKPLNVVIFVTSHGKTTTNECRL